MLGFEVATWVLFGAIAGLWADFFIRSPHHAKHLVLFGVIGAFVGGLLGRLAVPADSESFVGRYNVVALITAVIGAALAVSIDWYALRRREAHATARGRGRMRRP